jgi:hypothetical protein
MNHHRVYHKSRHGSVVVQPIIDDLNAIAKSLNSIANDLDAIVERIAADAAALAAGGGPAPQPSPNPVPVPAPPPTPSWPSYQGTSQFVGTSAHKVSIFVDPSLGAAGLQNANDLLDDAYRIVAANGTIFGTDVQPVNVIIFALGGMTDGTGGADHMACDFANGGNIEVCASFGQSMRCSALFEAELSECSMGGNLCGLSTGEALSRVCAMVVSSNALADFATAPGWARDGMQNWIDRTEQTDTGFDSIGCGVAFISWLRHKGSSLSAIATAMVGLGNAGTFAQLYHALGLGDPTQAWPTFHAAVQALPGGVTSDDPFGGIMA